MEILATANLLTSIYPPGIVFTIKKLAFVWFTVFVCGDQEDISDKT
jgi:hypothetical protein